MGSQAVAGRPSRLYDACARLDGLDREALQHELFTACQQHDPGPAATVHRLAVGRALVHLRRTGHDRYVTGADVAREAAERPGLPAAIADRVRRTAIPLGAQVHILGERYSGTIVHLMILRDLYDEYPAPWYVALCEPMATCRAHGADEIEPADSRTLPTHRPRILVGAEREH